MVRMASPSHPFRGRPVPQSRLGRLARLGGLAAGIGGNVLLGGAGRLALGKPLSLPDLLFTPANVSRLTNELARLRGAAMKVGQLVSMDAGGVLPPELAAIMARLRAEAEPMPPAQLRAVLDAAWGQGWEARFSEWNPQPIAAASIGQVHKAVTTDGRVLAVKVQYPGVRQSINSDVDNVGALLRLSGLVPSAIDIASLLAQAKRQLHEEADYRREARCLELFGRLLAGDPAFLVPAPVSELSSENVLAMSFLPGMPIEALEGAPQAVRDRAAGLLCGLALSELFSFGAMQTDPNFANYRFEPESGRVVLLDFGATRAFSRSFAAGMRRLALAGLAGNRQEARAAMLEAGILEEASPRFFTAALLVLFDTVFKAITRSPSFDFADPVLVHALEKQGRALSERPEVLRAPPVDVLFLQRKVAGLFLLGARLKAHVPLADMLRAALAEAPSGRSGPELVAEASL